MKKSHFKIISGIGVLLVLACLICSVLGCSENTVADPFRDFSEDISATCTLDIQGEDSKILFSRVSSEIKATFSEPSTIAGFTLTKTESGVTLGYGGLSVDIDESAAVILHLCEEVFSPHYSEMTVIRSEERDGEKLTVIESGGFIYRFSADGKPIGVSGIFDGRQFDIKILSIAPQAVENGGNAK